MSIITKALVFDMDGTMIDNKYFHDQAWIAFCEKYRAGASIDDFVHKYSGKRNEAILELVFGRKLDAGETLHYEDVKESMYRELYAPHFRLVDGLVDLLELAKNMGLKIAIATSAPRVNVDFVCQTAGIYHYFDVVVDASMVREGKPSPEVFLKAARELGVDPAGCTCFEDSRAGITASLRAGMKTVGIATELPVSELLALGAHEAYVDFTGIEIR